MANQYMRVRLEEIEEQTETIGTHIFFKGRGGRAVSVDRQGYHRIRLSIPGFQSKTMILARAVYILRHQRLDLYPGGPNVGLHVSHLCHEPLCIADNHLILEPQCINKNRIRCHASGKCWGHEGYSNCILH